MQTMTFAHAKEILNKNYEDRKNLHNNGYFPWDRGYREGYTDGIRYACELLGRVKESKE